MKFKYLLSVVIVFPQAAAAGQGAPATPDGSGSGSYEQQLQAALKTGVFDIRGPLGQKFSAMHKKGTAQHAMYNQGKGRKEKADFRLEWAKMELDTVISKKVYTKSYKVVSASMGTYKPFSMLVRDEGGDQEALDAAKRIASKCVILGGDWCSYNVMSERLEFLHLKREHNEIMTTMWQKYMEESNKSDKEQGLNSSSSTPQAWQTPQPHILIS